MKLQNWWATLMGALFLVGGLLELRSDFLSFNPPYAWIHIVTGAIFVGAVFKDRARKINDHLGIAYIFVGVFGLFGVLQMEMFVNLFHLVVAGIMTHGISHMARYG